MSLQYSKDAVIKGFVGIPDQFAIYGENNTFSDVNTNTRQENIDEIYAMTNNCRDYYEPRFEDECQYIPCVSESSVNDKNALPLQAPAPPMKKEDNMLLYALLIGVAVFVGYKILS